MGFYYLDNGYKIQQKNKISGYSGSFIDTSGTSRNIYGGNVSSNKCPLCFIYGTGSASTTGTGYAFPFASSSNEYNANVYSVPEQVGSTSMSYAFNSTTSRMDLNITVANNSADSIEVGSFYFAEKIFYSSSASADTLTAAYILSNKVTIPAGESKIFSMSISFIP